MVPSWLRSYDIRWLRPDLVAGLTLAAYLLPAGIGDASLAGLPPEAGLYACLFSGLVFWLFCSSTRTVITVTSALSLLIGASVGALSTGDPARQAALAAAVTLMVAFIALTAWLVRAGQAINFFSETVLVGFKAGLALYLASTQLPKLFGFKSGHGDFWENAGHFLGHLDQTHPAALTIGAVALAVLVAGKLWLKNRPIAFLVVVAGILASRMFDLEARGVSILGEVPQGLPMLGLPEVTRSDLNQLLPIAIAAFILAAVESSAIGRMFAQKHGERFEANRELLAIGASNLVSGLGRGFPVSGGMSQSLVNESAGARTPVSGLIAALFTLIVVLFATGLLRNLPQPVLAAVVLAAVMSLFDVRALRHIWHFNRAEFYIAIATLVAVLGSGPANGVLIGAAISIVLLLRRAAHPRVIEMVVPPGGIGSAERARHADMPLTEGVLVVRCEAALVYFNVEFVRDRIFALLGSRSDVVRLVVFDLAAVPNIDLAGAELVRDLPRILQARQITFHLAGANSEVRAALRRAGFEPEPRRETAGQTFDRVVSGWQEPPFKATAGPEADRHAVHRGNTRDI